MKRTLTMGLLGLVVTAALLATRTAPARADGTVKLLNVSYDPTRELYQDVNAAFAQAVAGRRPGRRSTVSQSHGGSGKQARSVIDGLEADVVTLALAYDIDAIAEQSGLHRQGLAEAAARQQLALHLDHRVPGAQGQPQGRSSDWDDLAKPGVVGDHAQPQDLGRRALGLSGGLGLRAAEAGRQRRRRRGSSSRKLYKNVPVLDSGARGSTTTFVQRGIGDVLVAWENEAYLLVNELGQGQVRDRQPAASASWPSRRSPWSTRTSTSTARARSPRPTSSSSTPTRGRRSRPRTTTVRAAPAVAAKHAGEFPKIKLFTIDERVRRLEEGAGDALRRRRHVRPDLHSRACMTGSSGGAVSCPRPQRGLAARAARAPSRGSLPGLRALAGDDASRSCRWWC